MGSDTILVVDDELSVRSVITAVLEEEGFQVLQASNGVECMKVFYDKRPDLVLLDILMPGKDGRETCRQIRELSDVPIIVLTALSDEKEKVDRFADGADDYIPKPFNNRELVARIHALLRRYRKYPSISNRKYDDGFLYVDFDAHQIMVSYQAIRLSPKQWRLLEYMINHKNRVVPHSILLRQIWGAGYENAENILKVAVSNLRGKLGDEARRPRYIHTDRTIGYRFEAHD